MRAAAIAVAVNLCGSFLSLAAAAAERPQFPPTRDVAVTYRLSADALDQKQTASVAFSAGMQKLHAELTGMGAGIVDLRQKSLTIVMTEQHMAMRMQAGHEIDRAMTLGSDGTIVRVGSDRVAGYPCTIWRFTGKDGSGTGCITDDGVPLRGQSTDAKNKGGFEAIHVEYGPQPPSLFEVPPGFNMMDMPSGLGGSRPKR